MKTTRANAMVATSLLVGVGMVLAVGSALADTATYWLVATDDACIDSATPDTNYGNALNLYVGDRTPAAGGTCWTFVQFDLSSIPSGVEIINAELLLYKHEKYGSPQSQLTVSAHRVTTPGWNETGITWNARPGFASTATAVVTDNYNPSGWASWTVTPDVIIAIMQNQPVGWCVKDTPPVSWIWLNFWSSEQVPMPDYRPMLSVTCTGSVANEASSWSEVKNLYR